MGKFVKLSRLWKVLLQKVHLPLRGTCRSRGGRSATQHRWSHFHKRGLWLQCLEKKTEVGAEHSDTADVLCVRTIKYSLKWALSLILPWLCQSQMFLLYMKATQRVLLRAGISSALPLGMPKLYENLRKLVFFWQCSFGNCQGILFLFCLTHIFGLESSDNYAQDFNPTHGTQSDGRETGRAAKEKR